MTGKHYSLAIGAGVLAGVQGASLAESAIMEADPFGIGRASGLLPGWVRSAWRLSVRVTVEAARLAVAWAVPGGLGEGLALSALPGTGLGGGGGHRQSMPQLAAHLAFDLERAGKLNPEVSEFVQWVAESYGRFVEVATGVFSGDLTLEVKAGGRVGVVESARWRDS